MSLRKQALIGASLISFLALTACGGNGGDAANEYEDSTATSSEESWTVPALLIDCDAEEIDKAGCIGPGDEGEFTSLVAADVEGPLHICTTVPHVSDPIWIAYNYAAITEAERLGVSLEYHDAGGYENIVEQVEQVENCVSRGADAIIIGAVSTDAINPALENALNNDIVVIDMGNGVSSADIPSRALVDYYQMGQAAAQQLLLDEEIDQVALLPGPAGAGWVERTVQGFRDALEGEDIEIVDVLYGDTAREVQLSLTEDVVAATPDLDAIVGTAVTMSVAPTVLAERGLDEEIDLFGTYAIPETLDLIESGRVKCAPSEQPVVTARMAVNLAVSLAQDKYPNEGYERYAPQPQVVCGEENEFATSIEGFSKGTSFAPADWSVRSSVQASGTDEL